jgi:hypothetical protein
MAWAWLRSTFYSEHKLEVVVFAYHNRGTNILLLVPIVVGRAPIRIGVQLDFHLVGSIVAKHVCSRDVQAVTCPT